MRPEPHPGRLDGARHTPAPAWVPAAATAGHVVVFVALGRSPVDRGAWLLESLIPLATVVLLAPQARLP